MVASKLMSERRRSLSKRPTRETTSFADVLREARIRRGFTRAEMARRYGATPTVISRLESGRGMVGEATIRRYAKALGLRIELKLVQAKVTR